MGIVHPLMENQHVIATSTGLDYTVKQVNLFFNGFYISNFTYFLKHLNKVLLQLARLHTVLVMVIVIMQMQSQHVIVTLTGLEIFVKQVFISYDIIEDSH
jgi:hypothetical protein